MLLHACGGVPAGLQGPQGPPGPPGASRGLQGASRELQGTPRPPQKPAQKMVLNEKCTRRVLPKPRTSARLKFHVGWPGWTRPPAMAGGGGRPRLRRVERGFLKGSERPEAGCLGEYLGETLLITINPFW